MNDNTVVEGHCDSEIKINIKRAIDIIPDFDGENIPVSLFIALCRTAAKLVRRNEIPLLTLMVRTKVKKSAVNHLPTAKLGIICGMKLKAIGSFIRVFNREIEQRVRILKPKTILEAVDFAIAEKRKIEHWKSVRMQKFHLITLFQKNELQQSNQTRNPNNSVDT